VLSAVIWLGGLIALVSSTRASTVPLLAGAPVCVASGVLLGLGTPWGLLRYRWVQAKWLIVACVAALASAMPALPVVSVGAHWAAIGALSIAIVLSLVRPGGRRVHHTAGRHRAVT
jgi:hypothetical protein